MDIKNIELPNKKRDAFLIGLVGTNRTGKTTKLVELILEYKKNNPKNKIMAFDPQNRLAEHIHYKIEDTHDLMNVVNEKDALIIFDDMRQLFVSDSTPPLLMDLLGIRDESGLDIIYCVHHPAFILQRLSYYTTHFFIHFCNLSKKVVGMDTKVPNAETIELLFQDIEKEVISSGGRDNGGIGEYPNFKHIVYYTQTATFKRCNY